MTLAQSRPPVLDRARDRAHARSDDPGAGQPGTQARAPDEEVFVDWVTSVRSLGPLAEREADRPGFDALLDRLARSDEPLPDTCSHRLGLVAGTSFGAAARWLRWAKWDPHGPRCRSYRSASYYVRGLVGDTTDLARRELAGADTSEADAQRVCSLAAAALGLAYSERADTDCVRELNRAADPRTLRAARERLLGLRSTHPDLVDRARLLLTDAIAGGRAQRGRRR